LQGRELSHNGSGLAEPGRIGGVRSACSQLYCHAQFSVDSSARSAGEYQWNKQTVAPNREFSVIQLMKI
jgi:hypothetical protein